MQPSHIVAALRTIHPFGDIKSGSSWDLLLVLRRIDMRRKMKIATIKFQERIKHQRFAGKLT